MGCIFAELLARQPLFPGNDYIDQLRLICSKLGACLPYVSRYVYVYAQGAYTNHHHPY